MELGTGIAVGMAILGVVTLVIRFAPPKQHEAISSGCAVHPTVMEMLREIKQTAKEKDDALWVAISEIRHDVKQLLTR